tara:strand:- start:1740 stop:2210 length:471 start_codon:yes stop_codon:yes gene_type:complete
MVDPITAYTVATTAIAGIRKAIQLGKDINDCHKEFADFFQAKDVVAKEASKQKKQSKGKNLTQTSLEHVLNLKKIRQEEKELKEMLVWSGQGDVYRDMVAHRSKLIREQKEQEARQKASFEHKKTIVTYVVVLGSVFSLCGYALYKFFLWLINYHK